MIPFGQEPKRLNLLFCTSNPSLGVAPAIAQQEWGRNNGRFDRIIQNNGQRSEFLGFSGKNRHAFPANPYR
jgi:hypothetical protein